MAVSIGIAVTQNSQSIANNTSNVTVKVNISWTYGSWNQERPAPSGWLKIDGVTYNFSSTFNPNRTNSGSQTLFTKTVDVQHNADGTKTLACSASFVSGVSSGTVAATSSTTLTTIPRATTPTVSGSLSLGSTITISTSSRASTGFTHSLYYSWGSQVINNLIASGVTTSTTWVIPKTLANYIRGGLSGTMFLRCVTYNGSTVIGEKTITLTISVPNTTEFQPKINSITGSDANDLPVARYVAGKSRLALTFSAVGAQVSGSSDVNSLLVSAVANIEGVNYSVSLGQKTSGTFTITSNLLQKTGGQYAVVTVTDSRGRTYSMSFAYTVFEYEAPQILSFTAKRCRADGTLDDSGNYVLCYLKTTVSPVDELNAKTYKIVYENGGSENTLASGTLSAYANNELSYNSAAGSLMFSVDFSWRVRAYVYDSFNTENPSVASVLVPTEKTFMDWRSNGNGIAFGKVSTKNGLEIGWEMFDRFDTYIRNGLAVYTGSGASAIDPDVTLEHLFLTDKNTPAAGFWYIENIFYSTKSETANRTQIAFPYDKKGSLYVRYYYNGAWSGWTSADAPVTVSVGEASGHMIFADGRKVCWGKVSITPSAANVVTSVTINFPVTFTKAPNITTMPHTSVPNVISFGVGAGTAVEDALTKMVIYMTRTNTVPTSFFWRAEGY